MKNRITTLFTVGLIVGLCLVALHSEGKQKKQQQGFSSDIRIHMSLDPSERDAFFKSDGTMSKETKVIISEAVEKFKTALSIKLGETSFPCTCWGICNPPSCDCECFGECEGKACSCAGCGGMLQGAPLRRLYLWDPPRETPQRFERFIP